MNQNSSHIGNSKLIFESEQSRNNSVSIPNKHGPSKPDGFLCGSQGFDFGMFAKTLPAKLVVLQARIDFKVSKIYHSMATNSQIFSFASRITDTSRSSNFNGRFHPMVSSRMVSQPANKMKLYRWTICELQKNLSRTLKQCYSHHQCYFSCSKWE